MSDSVSATGEAYAADSPTAKMEVLNAVIRATGDANALRAVVADFHLEGSPAGRAAQAAAALTDKLKAELKGDATVVGDNETATVRLRRVRRSDAMEDDTLHKITLERAAWLRENPPPRPEEWGDLSVLDEPDMSLVNEAIQAIPPLGAIVTVAKWLL